MPRTRPRKSPEEVSEARRQAVMRRHHPERFPDLMAPPGDSDVDRHSASTTDLPGHCAYDAIVGRPITYQDAVQREKAIAAELENDLLRESIQIKRRNLFTREQIEKRDEAMDGIVLAQLEQLVGFVGTLVPPEQGAAARAKAQEWVDGVRGRIATEIEAAAL